MFLCLFLIQSRFLQVLLILLVHLLVHWIVNPHVLWSSLSQCLFCPFPSFIWILKPFILYLAYHSFMHLTEYSLSVLIMILYCFKCLVFSKAILIAFNSALIFVWFPGTEQEMSSNWKKFLFTKTTPDPAAILFIADPSV